jgi:hypothetical protein
LCNSFPQYFCSRYSIFKELFFDNLTINEDLHRIIGLFGFQHSQHDLEEFLSYADESLFLCFTLREFFVIEGSHFSVMLQTGYSSHIDGPSKKFRTSFADGIIPVGLAGLIDFWEVTDIPYGLCGSGEVRTIGPQVGKDSGYGLVSNPWDGEEIFSWEGILRFLGREKLLDFLFELFNRIREVSDMSREDLEGGGSGLFRSA